MRQPRPEKRSYTPSRSNSYSQRAQDGDSPAAWTRKHKEEMEEMGLFMTANRTQATITDKIQQLCDQLLDAEYLRFRNETCVVRDVIPIVVPSPELLRNDGQAELDSVCEAMNAEWTQCDTLCGPRPKPEFLCGLSATAFTEEKEKLQLNHTSACPNLFPENMYFPFLVCEAKGGDRPIEEAERQAMHSASIATRAVIGLFLKVSATEEVHQQVLAFPVAHNHSTVMIFAHFATINGENPSFFRRLLLPVPVFSGDGNDLACDSYRQTLQAGPVHDHPLIGGAERRQARPSLRNGTAEVHRAA
ncbi:hypothetical protein LTR56_023045 [Elasticomyces elasticus]|nr:hypothetical protein LTR56_023045 [Elasticomyces elasticus]KAK3623646.1 hypothetical protein LTR22_024303 [Elasticomyces elasticus]KAK4904624.1 hypothetical protein LTR49_025959 [Elasticomyces elasticus]KAK5744826.1 hypothetical protein LTS12_023354 [Elasticomyces elasticus]